jgi:hypothetical protein
MSVDIERPKIVLRSPGDVAATIPALLGFNPSDSVVAVFLMEGNVTLTSRIDLDGILMFAEHVVATAEQIGADEVVIALYCERREGPLPYDMAVDDLIVAIEDEGIRVKGSLFIDAGRYWSYECMNEDCCSTDGVLIPEGHELEAERIGAGLLSTAEDRDAIIERYRPLPDLAASPERLAEAAPLLHEDLIERCHQCWDVVQLLDGRRDYRMSFIPILTVMLQIGMSDISVRDFVIASIAGSEGNIDALTDVVVQAALTAPVDLRPRIAGAAAALLAASMGNSLAVNCMLDLAGDESLADLVRISQGIPTPPKQVRELLISSMPMVMAQISRSKAEEVISK